MVGAEALARRSEDGRSGWITVEALPALRRRIERLRWRAERLDAAGPILVETDERRRRQGVEQCLVEIRGVAPKLEGWRVVAELRHGDEATGVEVLPGEELPPGRWQEASPRCDYCGLRRRRRRTLLLRHRSGDVAQVGTNCLADFTGERDPLAAIDVRRALAEVAEASLQPESAEPTLVDYLAAVAAEARERGFVAKAKASDSAETTAERAPRRIAERQTVQAADRELAHEIERWVLRELAQKERPSRYEQSLVSVFQRSERVGERDRAIVASAWLAHERAQRESAKGEHLGEVGERIEVEVRVEQVKRAARDSRWGPVFWHALRDDRGHWLSWFAVATELKDGDRYRLRGRVRRHASWRGRAVTVLERCRVVAEVG